jgi:hypothetical protein
LKVAMEMNLQQDAYYKESNNLYTFKCNINGK